MQSLHLQWIIKKGTTQETLGWFHLKEGLKAMKESGKTVHSFSPSVLAQLVLTEFLASFDEVLLIRESLTGIAQNKVGILPRKSKRFTLHIVQEAFSRLISPKDLLFIDHPWTPFQGPLAKLRYYARLLIPPLDSPQEALLFYEAVSSACGVAVQAIELANEAGALKFLKAMEQLARRLPPFIDSFYKDENVLFFLARHSERFNALYGRGFMQILFQSNHYQGTAHIRSFLLKRYEQRGFSHLAPEINAALDVLEQ